jgi:hypothetical protein
VQGDVPRCGADYDADGKADLSVYRPWTGEWLVQRSSDGQVQTIAAGDPGDYPVQ